MWSLWKLCGVFASFLGSLQGFGDPQNILGVFASLWEVLESLSLFFFCSFLGIFGNHAESLEVSMGLWKALGFFASCAASLQACRGLCNLTAAFGRLTESRIPRGDKREDLPVLIAQEALEAQTHSALFPTQALLCAIGREIGPGEASRDVCANLSTRTLMSGGSWFRSYT